MSLLAATQIPKPADEQAFERACIPLWIDLLKDPAVSRNGRRGQRQNGVDLYGTRGGNPSHYVGIQCKLKGDGKSLDEDEVRGEVRKALTFKPPLREYYIVTTAPDDVATQELARLITGELHDDGKTMRVFVWGWNTLEEKIFQSADARKAFDPDYGPFSEKILTNTEQIIVGQDAAAKDMADIKEQLTLLQTRPLSIPGDGTISVEEYEKGLDAEIDGYRELNNTGKPQVALGLLEALLVRIRDTASGRLLFRIKANIGSCHLHLGDERKAGELLSEAYEHAPHEPKAVANKAFSFLLLGEPLQALLFSRDAIAKDPTNDHLAGILIQAARFDPSIENGLELVPEDLRETSPVMIANIEFLRRRGRTEWRDAARAARENYPDERYAVQFAAEAELDEILNDEVLQRTKLYKPGERERLKAAAADLQALFERSLIVEDNFGPEESAVCGNLVVALFESDDLQAALDVAKAGLARNQNDPDLLKRAAVVAIEIGDDAAARQSIDAMEPSPDRTILAFSYYSDQGDWKAIVELARDQDNIPDIERPLIETVARIAACKLEGGDVLAKSLPDIAATASVDPRSNIVIADFARMEGLDDIAETAFLAARDAIHPDSHIAARTMVAVHAGRRGAWAIAADLLNGYVNEDRDSPLLRRLAAAFVNDLPIKQRAIDFFDRLPHSIREDAYYLHAEGVMSVNRGALAQAEALLRRAVAADPDLSNYLALFSVLRRRNKAKEIRPIIDGINLDTLVGTPGDKMFLAQQMRACGLRSEAIALAYDVLINAPNDPDAALRYFGLVMMNPNDRMIPRAPEVAIGTWVRVVSSDQKNFEFLIEEGDGRPGENIFGPSHPMVAAAMGRRVKDRFTVRNGLGTVVEWQVVEIKHKYLHALHVMMASFEQRFPGVKGFSSITMREGDVQPALDQVKRLAERNENVAELYLVQHLPLSALASIMGRDTIQFADFIRSLGHDLAVCIGNDPERLAAGNLITRHRAAGAVLDTYTAWTAATTGSFDILSAVFGTLIVAQSTIDEIRSIVLDDKQLGKGTSMTIAWLNGQYVRQVMTAADRSSRRKFIKEQLENILASCQVFPAVAPDEPTELAVALTENLGTNILDPAHLSAQGFVLLSEDLYYRQVANDAVGVNGTWLQAVFAFALETGIIESDRYADLAVKLAWRRHAHVSTDAHMLANIFKRDLSSDLSDFRQLANYIGTKDADMSAHLGVVNIFLNSIWGNGAVVSTRVMAATGIVLEKLVRFRQDDWSIVLAFISEHGGRALKNYIHDWANGHFLSSAELLWAQNEVNRSRSRRMMAALMRRL